MRALTAGCPRMARSWVRQTKLPQPVLSVSVARSTMESAEKKRDGSASRFEEPRFARGRRAREEEAVARSGVLLNSRLEEQTLGELLNLLNNPYESIHQEIR